MARSSKSELARERAIIAQKHKTQTLSSIMRTAASSGALPVGQDPIIDAWRNLTANLLVMPPGQWKHDALLVPVQWSDLDQTMLADLLLISGRSDVIEALDIPWTTLSATPDRDGFMYDSGRHVYHALPVALAEFKDFSWLVTRLLRGEYNTHSAVTLEMGLSYDNSRMERVFNTTLALGLGPDTRVSTHTLGLDTQDVRFVDVALIHDNAKIAKKMLSKARWTQPKQAISTLWALSLRACQEWSLDKGHHASLSDGTLARHLLALEPDPQTPLDLTWHMRSCLGLGAPMEFFHHDVEPKPIPLAFACLLAIHNNQHDALPSAARPIHQWCIDKIVSTPALLEAVVPNVVVPLLERLAPASLGEVAGPLRWSGTELVDALVPHLPPAQATKLAQQAFDCMLDCLDSRRLLEDVCAKLSKGFPVQTALPRASLGQDQAQRLIRILSTTDVPWDSWGVSPGKHPDVSPIIEMFEPQLAKSLIQRLSDMAHLIATDDGRTLSKRLALLGEARLADRSTPRSKL